MNVYLVTIKKTGWCQDYAMVVVAEDENTQKEKQDGVLMILKKL